MTSEIAPTLPEVARIRGWQALAQGLVIDVVVAVCLVIVASLDGLDSWAAAKLFLASLGKTAVIAAAQYLVRRYRDTAGYDDNGDPVAPPEARRAA